MRIQILPLPSVMVGDDMEEPFALIVDQHDSDVDEQTADEWQRFKESVGARALLITPDTVEVVDRYAQTPVWESTPTVATVIEKVRAFGSAHLEPNTIVLRDRNGNPMNMSVTCSCGKPMGRAWTAIDSDSRQERTEITCQACGNRLTVTVPLGENG